MKEKVKEKEKDRYINYLKEPIGWFRISYLGIIIFLTIKMLMSGYSAKKWNREYFGSTRSYSYTILSFDKPYQRVILRDNLTGKKKVKGMDIDQILLYNVGDRIVYKETLGERQGKTRREPNIDLIGTCGFNIILSFLLCLIDIKKEGKVDDMDAIMALLGLCVSLISTVLAVYIYGTCIG